MLLNIILPGIGILIILFTLGAYVVDYAAEFRQSNQRFKGLGLDIQISVITIYILLGLAFVDAGVYLNTTNKESRFKIVKNECDSLNKQLSNLNVLFESYKSQNITYNFTLDSIYYKNKFPDPET